MKIKNLKYLLGIIFVGSFFLCGITLGQEGGGGSTPSGGSGCPAPSYTGTDGQNCDPGFDFQSPCCVPRCANNPNVWDGDGCNTTCSGDTKANEAHTRCICDPDKKCCGVELNMTMPFIGNCIELNNESSRDGSVSVTSVTAFPILMQGLMKLLMSAIMVFSFLMIIVSGLMIVSGAFGGNGFATGKKIIKNVIISLILLGCSGLILSLINPSFFGG